ncbi:hypothetical protein ACVWZL_001378 [Bradyrhizobium sp. GM2.4]
MSVLTHDVNILTSRWGSRNEQGDWENGQACDRTEADGPIG